MTSIGPGRDVHLVPSSPPRPQFKTFTLDSSPLQPSPWSSVQKRPAIICGGSNAAPIPLHAAASFTIASSLLKSNNALGLDLLDSLAVECKGGDGEANSSFKTVCKPRAKRLDDGASNKKGRLEIPADQPTRVPVVKENAARKPRASKVEIKATEEAVLKKKVVRKPRIKKTELPGGLAKGEGPTKKVVKKPRSKKAEGEMQPKLAIAQVAKAGIEKIDKTDAAISKYFSNSRALDVLEDDFGLVEAVHRRTAWTPPRILPELAAKGIPAPASTNHLPESAVMSTANERIDDFSNLLSTFGYSNNTMVTRKKSLTSGAGPKKRKVNELVATNTTARTAKKARTLTELATSAYSKENNSEPAPLLQYFPPGDTERAASDGFRVPGKPSSHTKKSKKGTIKAPILLSPESALKQVTSQDFVFGTSSQLAREQSPTLLRDLHAAMQASNELDDDPFADILTNSGTSSIAPIKTSSAKRNLWSAASRDETNQNEVQPQINKIDSDANSLKTGPTKTVKSPARKPSKAAPIAETQMPNFEAYTTAQLTEEIASYRFKPVKKREQMILLLEKCWESKQRIALGALGTNEKVGSSSKKTAGSVEEQLCVSQDTTVLPKKPRGRPRKDKGLVSSAKPKSTTKLSTQGANVIESLDFDSDVPLSQIHTPTKLQSKTRMPMEDISDSDLDLTPSRCAKSQVRSPVVPLTLRHSSPTIVEDVVLPYDAITKAIMTGQSAKDPNNPSWHEKILLYDPIVLEDLTVWLNTGGLETVGWDGEVEPKEVKKWCESQSICCLWRESLRNGTRNRY